MMPSDVESKNGKLALSCFDGEELNPNVFFKVREALDAKDGYCAEQVSFYMKQGQDRMNEYIQARIVRDRDSR